MKGVNVPILVASLVLSLLLWLVVYAQNLKPMTPVRYVVKLDTSGLDSNRLIVTDMAEVFRFSAVGPEDKLRNFKDDRLVAVVDLSDAQPGERSYPVVVIPEEIGKYITTKPLRTALTIEPVEERTIPVRVEGQGSLENPDLTLLRADVEPKEVVIRGAKSLVDRAIYARARLDLAIIDAGAVRPTTVGVDIVDSDDGPLSSSLVRADPLFVRITPLLAVAPEEKAALVMPQFVGQPASGYVPAGYTWEPKQVILRGPSLTLASITKLMTEPIDITGATKPTTITAKLKLPKGVSIHSGGDTVTVSVNIQPFGNSPGPKPIEPPKIDGAGTTGP